VKPTETSRQTRILDAAEIAFADFGFAGASLREIVGQARVNLATVYYYFGSKRGLLAAVFERRFGPLRQEHLELLGRLEAEAKGKPLPVEKILTAMLTPPLRLAGAASARHKAVLRLIGRALTVPNPQTQELLHQQHREVRAAYLAALRRSLPDLPEPDLQWRFQFFWGALALILCNPGRIEKMTGGACNPADTKAVLSQMTAFCAAGFRAGAASKSVLEKASRRCRQKLGAPASADPASEPSLRLGISMAPPAKAGTPNPNFQPRK